MRLFKEVDFENGEPCSVVGVHPLRWHDHPDQPTIGLVDIVGSQNTEDVILRILDSYIDGSYPDSFIELVGELLECVGSERTVNEMLEELT